MNEKFIAACGNDCAACPRYVAHPYEKTDAELHHTAELWMKIGYRDHIVSNDEISCTGCKPENWCRYHVVECCEDKGIRKREKGKGIAAVAHTEPIDKENGLFHLLITPNYSICLERSYRKNWRKPPFHFPIPYSLELLLQSK